MVLRQTTLKDSHIHLLVIARKGRAVQQVSCKLQAGSESYCLERLHCGLPLLHHLLNLGLVPGGR